MSKIKNGWLDQCGAECFDRLIFDTRIRVGLKGLSYTLLICCQHCLSCVFDVGSVAACIYHHHGSCRLRNSLLHFKSAHL